MFQGGMELGTRPCLSTRCPRTKPPPRPGEHRAVTRGVIRPHGGGFKTLTARLRRGWIQSGRRGLREGWPSLQTAARTGELFFPAAPPSPHRLSRSSPCAAVAERPECVPSSTVQTSLPRLRAPPADYAWEGARRPGPRAGVGWGFHCSLTTHTGTLPRGSARPLSTVERRTRGSPTHEGPRSGPRACGRHHRRLQPSPRVQCKVLVPGSGNRLPAGGKLAAPAPCSAAGTGSLADGPPAPHQPTEPSGDFLVRVRQSQQVY